MKILIQEIQMSIKQDAMILITLDSRASIKSTNEGGGGTKCKTRIS